jgi:hypothetical protein
LAARKRGGIEEQLATLTAKGETLTEALGGQGNAGTAEAEPQAQAHVELARQLHAAQSQWHSFGKVADDDGAA